MDLHLVIPNVVIGIGSVLLFVAAFHGKTGRAPWPIRSAFLLAAPFALISSVLGLYRQFHHATHRDWILSHLEWWAGGITLGVLFTLLVNPDFYRAIRGELRSGLTKR